MKHILGYLILFFSFNAYAITVENEIHAVMDQSAKTWNHGDLETFLNIYKKSDGIRSTGSNLGIGHDFYLTLAQFLFQSFILIYYFSAVMSNVQT